MAADLPELVVADAAAWRRWLEGHLEGPGVWLVLARSGQTEPTRLTHAEALDEALCVGWIDGQVRAGGAAFYRQRFTPRRRRSAWSRRNVEHAERLGREGRLHASGIAEIERARADGRWQAAYAGAAAIEVPADLAAALAARPEARSCFETLSSQNRYAVLYRLETAKRPETRARRLAHFVEMLARGETFYPQRRAPGSG